MLLKRVTKLIVLVSILGLAVFAVAADCKGPCEQNGAQKADDPIAESYVIGTEDVLAINVWKEPEISRSVPVRPDGKISLPLVGEIEARGLTPMQLQKKLETDFTAYIAHPDVTVIVEAVKSLKFNILGEVAHPGSYNLSKPMTVLDGIAVAGGFRDFAKKKDVYILRVQADGKQVKLPFNYKDVIKGHHLDQNVELQSHDTIVVP